jgi:hypothetical protein
MNSTDMEKIDQVITMLKETSEFFNNIDNMIENGTKGYELNFEEGQFRKYIWKKEEEYENSYEYEDFLDRIDLFYGNNFITIGNERIKDLKEKEDKKGEYHNIYSTIKKGKDFILKKIGYLEFLKQRPEEIKDKINYEKDFDYFIVFLDEKYKEWEQTKSRKKD